MNRRRGTEPSTVLEIHREPGPPRSTIVVHDGYRVCDLEVAVDGSRGTIRHLDGWRREITHPPASGEWWVADARGTERAIVSRVGMLGEQYDLTVGGGVYRIRPRRHRWVRRRWSVRDADDREVLELVQRLFTRPVHDLTPRAGDLPEDLAWVVAWLLAERLSRGQSDTRRQRWYRQQR